MKIYKLPEQDARRIAAGEVIERPASALRELLDNAIDAQSTRISVVLEEGGLKSLQVIDNGTGIDKEDLPLAVMVHTTSKIRCLEDLDHSYTLGFRGEALASLSACSKVNIISRTADQDTGYSLYSRLEKQPHIKPVPCQFGTKVTIEEIFYNLPARRRFLKSAGHEQKECRQVFFEKALSHPHIEFQYFSDDQMKYHFLKTDLPGRTKQIFAHVLLGNPLVLHSENETERDGFSITIVAGTPQNYYHNRKYIHIYVNGRRIEEYSLTQAVVYAYDSVLPGGQFPVAFVFLRIRADLIDFNIHPAKREAKIRNLSSIHKNIVHLLQNEVRPTHATLQQASAAHTLPYHESMPNMLENTDLPFEFASPKPREKSALPVEKQMSSRRTDPSPEPAEKEERPWVYIGQAMGVFLIAERENTLFLIDQHAAHERILFDMLCEKPPQSQRLLSPIELDVTDDEMKTILSYREELAAHGIEIEPTRQANILHITACPPGMNSEFWQKAAQGECLNLQKELYASMACKQAIKEGEYLDDATAKKLIAQTFALPQPFCPHGRPLWIQLPRQQLYQWIKRLV